MIEHIRRPDPMPHNGQWIMGCDCGWVGHAAQMDGLRPRGREEIEPELEQAFVDHVPAADRRSYLLVDSRKPKSWLPFEDILADERGVGGASFVDSRRRAKRRFEAQPTLVGTFLMPEGQPVQLLEWWEQDDVRIGRAELQNGLVLELPIGEVRTEDGKVYRLDE